MLSRGFSSLLRALIDAIVPPRATEQTVEALTLSDLERLHTGEGLPYRDPAVRALVWELKYNRNPRALALAGELLARELLGIAEDELGMPLLVPVPMHPRRRRERGFNQTELLCEAALQHVPDAFKYAPKVLARTTLTPPQQQLPRRRRLENAKGSMRAADAEKVRGRVCVVVDDVSTTGATLAEARRALLSAGAKRVHTLALARSQNQDAL